MRDPKINGVFVPLVTPLDRRRALDKASVERLLKTLKPKVAGFIPCLSTGEGRHLNDDLWAQMLESTLSFAGKLPVIAGIEQETTNAVLARVRIAQSMGIKTIASLPPFGEDVTQEEIYRHFASIAETGINILVYNKELMSGIAIALETLVRLCSIPNVVAVKEGSSNPEFTQSLLDQVQDVSIMQAWETLLTKTRTHGSIVPLANLEPELCRLALSTPTEELQREIDEAVRRYHLEAENPTWYRDAKQELVKRGIITSASCCD